MSARLFLVLISLFAVSAFADGVAQTMDGQAAYCQQDSQVGLSAYQIDSTSVSVQGSTVTLALAVEGLSCAKTNGQYNWAPYSLTADFTRPDLNGNPETVHSSNLVFQLASQNYDSLGTIAAQNVSSQLLNYSVSVQKAVTAQQWQELQAGQTITVHWEFYSQGILTATDGGVTTQLGQVAGGLDSVLFHLSLVNGTYVVN